MRNKCFVIVFIFFLIYSDLTSQIQLVSPGSENPDDFDIVYSTETVFMWRSSLKEKKFFITIEKETEPDKYEIVYDSKALKNFIADTFFNVKEQKIISDKSFFRWKILGESEGKIYESKYFYFYVYVDSFIVVTAEREREKKKKEDYIDIQLELVYERAFSDKYIKTYYDQKEKKFYIPFINLMRTFGFNPLVNLKAKTAKFFLYKENKDLVVRFGKFEYQLGKNKEEFTFKKNIEKDKDFYISIEDFAKITDIDLKVDFNALRLNVIAKKTLPILARINKAKLFVTQPSYDLKDPATLALDFKPRWIGINILDYQVYNNVSYKGSMANSFNYSAGGELLKGAFEHKGSYNFYDNRLLYSNNYFALKYYFENLYLTTLYLGDFYNYGKFQNSAIGFYFSNQSLKQRKIYGVQKLHRKTIPNSEIELYFNNQLYDVVKASKDGSFSFDIPLVFGTSAIEYKIFSGSDLIGEKKEIIYVPSDLIEKGKLEYRTSFGKLKNYDEYIGMFEFGYGLFANYSLGVGAEYFSLVEKKKPFFFAKNYLRFWDFNSISANYYHNLSFDFSFASYYKVGGYANFEFQKIINKKYQILTNRKDYYSLNLGNSFAIGENSIGTDLRLMHVVYNKRYLYGFLNIFYNFRLFETGLNYRLSGTIEDQNRYEAIGANFGFKPSYFILKEEPWFRNLKFNFRYLYSFNNRGSGFRIEAYNFFKGSNIIGAFFETTSRGANYYGLRATIDFGFLQYNFNAYQNAISNMISGSVIYESASSSFFLNSYPQIGYGNIFFYSYYDVNENGVFDSGENYVKNASIMPTISSRIISKEYFVILTNIQPFEDNFFMVKEPINYDNLNSRYTNLAIKMYPNLTRSVYLPYYSLYELNGKVTFMRNGSKFPLRSIDVYLVSKNNKMTYKTKSFSDGSFYFYKVLPGVYKLELSKEQLKILGLEMPTEEYTITIPNEKNFYDVEIIAFE